MIICAKEAKKIEVEDRIQKTDGEDEETVLDFLAQYEVCGYLKKWRWIWQKNFKVGKGAQMENAPFFVWFFCASVDVGGF